MIKCSILKKQFINKVAEIHKNEIDSFLSSLPLSYIKFWYNKNFNENKIFGVTALLNDEVIGFIIGSKEADSLFKQFIEKYPLKFLFALTSLLFKNPFKILILFKKNKREINKVQLLYIAIDKKYQSRGFAYEMLKCFEENFFMNSVYYLEVDMENSKAIKFYKKNNFKVITNYNDIYVFKKNI